jgi:hypothetical protein
MASRFRYWGQQSPLRSCQVLTSAMAVLCLQVLPSSAGERDHAVGALLAEKRTVVILEAPHRIEVWRAICLPANGQSRRN